MIKNTSTISKNGNLRDARIMIIAAAKAAGYTIEGYHGSKASFNEFDYARIGSSTKAAMAENVTDNQTISNNARIFREMPSVANDVITEKATLSFNTEPATENSEGIRDKGHLFITSILQNALKVNVSKKILPRSTNMI